MSELDEDMVTMSHPDIDAVGTATKTAFETVWAPKGWVIAKPSKSDTDPAAEPPKARSKT